MTGCWLTRSRQRTETGIRGKAVTPFLLDHLYQASGGASLEANIWAVRNNVAWRHGSPVPGPRPAGD